MDSSLSVAPQWPTAAQASQVIIVNRAGSWEIQFKHEMAARTSPASRSMWLECRAKGKSCNKLPSRRRRHALKLRRRADPLGSPWRKQLARQPQVFEHERRWATGRNGFGTNRCFRRLNTWSA